MILLDNTRQSFDGAIRVDGLVRHYGPADIMITRASGNVGSLDRLPVRRRIERGGYILVHTLPISHIESWFDKRLSITATLLTRGALQSWLVVIGVVEANLLGTVGTTSIAAAEFNAWLTESRLSGCVVSTIADHEQLSVLTSAIETVLLNNGPVVEPAKVESMLSMVPHVGPIVGSVLAYCGNAWSALAFLTNKDLFNTLPLNPKAREALNHDYFTREMQADIRTFLGLERDDYGLGLYISEE